MIGHRDGHEVVLCDGCYRPKRSGELGWSHSDEGGLPASRGMSRERDGRVLTGENAEQGLDYCPDPDCVQAQAEAKVRA